MLPKSGFQAVFLTYCQKVVVQTIFKSYKGHMFDILAGIYTGLNSDIWLTQNRTKCNI